MNKYILPIKPSEYLKQGRVHCGMYAIKGVLSAYGLDDKKNPEDYHSSFFGRVTGGTLPRTFHKVLKRYGLKAEVKLAQDREGKIDLLKFILQKDQPVILLVGNGYGQNGSYSPYKAKFSWHWITLWGFDDQEKVFYVYDPVVSKEKYDPGIPIGNKKRTYDEIVRQWGGGNSVFWFLEIFIYFNKKTIR